MCRNIKTLYNYQPPATKAEIELAALQYVRKISGFQKPSQINKIVFETAVDGIAAVTADLVKNLKTGAAPKNREIEAEKARQRNQLRFGK